MAVSVREEMQQTTSPVVVMRAVKAPAVCGDCRHHVPQATQPTRWCRLRTAQRHGQQVEAGQRACADFAAWPEDSPVPAFLAAMQF